MPARQCEEMKNAIHLVEVEGKTQAEAARIAGVSKAGLSQALKKRREQK